MTLRISADLSLPLEVVGEANAIIAKRNAGKTYLGKKLAEAMLQAKQQIVVLEPTDVWYGLRSSADGKGPGYPIAIFGGPHGDLPLEPTAGAYMADLLVGERLSAVLCLRPFSKTHRRRFVADFAERLLQISEDLLHVFLEEAHEWIPQRPVGEAARMLGATSDLTTTGRTMGIGTTIITQRIARVHKDPFEQTDNLFVLRTVGSNDRKAIEGWVKAQDLSQEAADMMRALPKLKQGQAFVYAPALLGEPQRISVDRLTTFDSSATPKPGQSRREPKSIADVNLEHVREAMSDAIERAKANDPKELRREITRLKQTVEKLESRRPDTREVEKIVEVPVPLLEPADVDRLDKVLEGILKAGGQIGDQTDALMGAASSFRGHLQKLAGDVRDISRVSRHSKGRPEGRPEGAQSAKAQVRAPLRRDTEVDTSRDISRAEESDLGKGEKTVLNVLAQWPQGRTHNELAFLAGYSAKASTLGVILSKLRKLGLVEAGKPIRLTAEGEAQVGGFEELPSGRELLDHWLSHPRMGEGERKVLTTLIDSYPDELSHVELCEATGYSPDASTIGVILSKLRKLGLVEKGRRQIAPEFMEAISR